MWRRFKKQLREFRAYTPGERFQEHYRSRQKSGDRPTSWTRVLNFVLAGVSFVLGIVFSIIPGVPGFVFFLISAALLAAESYPLARLLDATELNIRTGWKRVKGRRGRGKQSRRAHATAPPRLSRAVKSR